MKAECDFSSDTTLMWPCRRGDYVLWFTCGSIFADPEHGLRIKDIWEMKDGDFLTITNRIEDIPEWFSFHPTEVCNSIGYRMLEKFNNDDYPEEPIEGPNIWRLKTGDRLAWLGKPRSDSSSNGKSISVLSLFFINNQHYLTSHQ